MQIYTTLFFTIISVIVIIIIIYVYKCPVIEFISE